MLTPAGRFAALAVVALAVASAAADLVVCASEGKIDLRGGAKVIDGAEPDSLTILDFAVFPPRVEHVIGVPNSVIGPPSNVALAPGRRWALVASAIRLSNADPRGWEPDNRLQVIDLSRRPAAMIAQVETGPQPSGISVSPDGSWVLVANRAGRTVSVFTVNEEGLSPAGQVVVCEEGEGPVDVAFTADGRGALVAVNAGGYVRPLRIQGAKVEATQHKVSVYGHPYRCAVSRDGRFAATVGWGNGNGPDATAVTLIDLSGDRPRATDFIATGFGAESLAISPAGDLIAVALINGSDRDPADPNYHAHGMVDLLARTDTGWRSVCRAAVGPIPEGVAFAADGRYLVVQCHPEQRLWLLEVDGHVLRDTGHRIDVPGMPSGIASGW